MTQPSGPDTGSRRPGGSGAPDPDDQEPQGRLRPLGPGPLVVLGLVGLVGGWLVRPMSIRAGNVAPSVPPVSVGLIFFGAAIVALAAYSTWRTVHREHKRLPSHQAVNRLVLARACALVGAVVLGGYLGNAIAHLGVGEGHARSQVWWSLAAAAGGAALLVASLMLERACRVPRRDT